MHRILALAAVALALAACEPDLYEYVPVTYATYGTTEGLAPEAAGSAIVPKPGGDAAAADFPIPKDHPRGDLRVASYGLVDVGPQSQTGQHISAVHVRMILGNDGDRPWTLDTREQRIALEGHGTSVAAFASADPGATSPPAVVVPPKGKRTVDLFFPLPADLQGRENLPSFETLWRVQTGDQVVEGSAPFASIAVAPPPVATMEAAPPSVEYYGPDYYWGPPYWYNPYWADFGFYGAVVIPPFYFGSPLWVHRRGHYGYFHPYNGWYGWHGYPGRPYAPHGAYPHRGYPYGHPRPYHVHPRAPGALPHGVTPYRGAPHGGYHGAPRGGSHGGGFHGGGHGGGGRR